MPGSEGRVGITRRFPIGPIVGISPFNFPLNLVAHKVAPALAAGNTILLKPAPKTPLTALLLAEIIASVGVPNGAVGIFLASIPLLVGLANAQFYFNVGFVVVLLLSLSWHEAAHAWVADRLGDPTARDLGRVTLNPIRHLDLFLSVLLPLMLLLANSPVVFGGGKPVPIDVRNFRHKARDFMLVAVAGPFSNLLLAAVFGLLYVLCVALGMFQESIPNPYGPATPHLPSIIFPEESIPSR